MHLKVCAIAAAAAMTLATAASAGVTSFSVNGETITKAQQEMLIQQYTARGQARSGQMESQVRFLLTRDQLLQQEARKMKLAEREDVRKMIDNATKNILMSTGINDWLEKNPVKDEEVCMHFEAEKKRWGDKEVRVRHILVKDEETAKTVLAKVRRNPQDFAKLAAEYSADTQVNKSHGGLIEWTSPNMFEQDFAEGFKSLKVGSIAPKPIKTALGWHIVKLEGSRKAQRYADFDTEAPELRQRLVAVKVQSYIEELIKTAKIKDLK